MTFAFPRSIWERSTGGMSEGKMEVQVDTPRTQAAQEPIAGTVTFVNNTVDISTATIRLKATFQNKDRRLWPGQTVNVASHPWAFSPRRWWCPARRFKAASPVRTLLWSSRTEPPNCGRSSWPAARTGKRSLRRGSAPGETVVTDGQLLLTPGAKVSVKEQNSGRKESPKK